MQTTAQGQTGHVTSTMLGHPAVPHLTFSHVETIHITNGPPINLAASIHAISHVDSRYGPDSFLAIRHLQADAQVPQIAVLAHRATAQNHRPMTHSGQATDPPAGIDRDRTPPKTTGIYTSVVDLDRSHVLRPPGHARPQLLAGYAAEQTVDRSATRNTRKQVHMTSPDHTLLGVIPIGTCHRETRPGVPERKLDPRGDRDIPHQCNTAGNGPGAATAG